MTQRPGLWLRRHRHLFAFAWAVLWVCRVEAQVTRDRSPHRAGSTVHGGARLHWLAWGTKGPAVVLLPGYSLTAHVFDDIGPLLAVDHRVIALTPRGFGESDAPDSSAYTVPTLVEDLHVEYYGSQVPISQVANVSLLDARTITVQPWEKGMGAKIERAIREYDLASTRHLKVTCCACRCRR